jgi:hypothetical protein
LKVGQQLLLVTGPCLDGQGFNVHGAAACGARVPHST